MPLILRPKFDDLSRAEIEAHIEAVRARRMAAVVQYHAGVNAKLRHASAKINDRLAREYSHLARDIEKLDKLDEKIRERMESLDALYVELEQTHERMQPDEDET